MKPTSPHALPAAPKTLLNAQGEVQFGRYAGALAEFDWQAIAPQWQRSLLWRRLHHKRWRYISLATDEIFCGIAIVDLGWASSAFAYVFERASQREIASFSQEGLPYFSCRISPQAFALADCRFAAFGKQMRFAHIEDSERYQLEIHGGHLHIQAEIDGSNAGPALLAVGQVAGGTVHATQKTAAMRVKGQVIVAGQEFALDGGVDAMDYSNGFLARDTHWRWACAQSEQLGFNLQQGYFAGQENALWLDGQLYPLAAAHFEFDANAPEKPWQITTADGLLELEFTPEGIRRQNKNLKVAISRYVQPIGQFSGWVKAHADAPKVEVARLIGVTEDHFSRW